MIRDEPTVLLLPSQRNSASSPRTPISSASTSRKPKPPTGSPPRHTSQRAHRGLRAPATGLSATPTLTAAPLKPSVSTVVSAPRFKYRHGRLTQVAEKEEETSQISNATKLPAGEEEERRLSPTPEDESQPQGEGNANPSVTEQSAEETGSETVHTSRQVTVLISQEQNQMAGGSLPDLTADELANSFIKAAITPRVIVTPLPTGSDSFSAVMSEISSESSSAFPSTSSLAFNDVGDSDSNALNKDMVNTDDGLPEDGTNARSLSSHDPPGPAVAGNTGIRQRAYSLPASILKSSAPGQRKSHHVHFRQKLTNTMVYTKRTLTRVD